MGLKHSHIFFERNGHKDSKPLRKMDCFVPRNDASLRHSVIAFFAFRNKITVQHFIADIILWSYRDLIK